MSFSYNKLRGKIREVFGTQESFAKALGVSVSTLSLRLNNVTDFSQTEILKAKSLLDIGTAELDDYFFTEELKKTEEKKE